MKKTQRLVPKPPRLVPKPCERCCGSGKGLRVNPEWLRYQRKAAGFSQKQMAQHCGVSIGYIRSIELGGWIGDTEMAYAELKPA